MSILGAVVRAHPRHLDQIIERLRPFNCAEVALDPGDGRLVILLDDQANTAEQSAAQVLGVIATWPEVLSTSLVYEYSGPDAPPPAGMPQIDFRAWRGTLDRARQARVFSADAPANPSAGH